MNDAPANAPALEIAKPQQGEGWTVSRWLAVITLVFATHITVIFLFGEKKEIAPLPGMKLIPTLTLANNSDELLALNDPTLFALPHRRDFASAAWLKMPAVKQPVFRWTEPPHPLPLSADMLGMVFSHFMQTNFFASEPPDFKPAPELSTPTLPVEPALAQNSTMQIAGELAQRQLPSQISLTNWPYADVLAPCVVQVLVDAAGNVVSTVLLTPSGYDVADQRALELARALRFTPSSRLTFGRIIFNWHTVPPTNETNR
jgi:TonB family protein